MSCANDSGWEDEGQKTNIVNIHECVLWSHLLQLRNLYNLVRDKCAEYGIELELPIGRPKYGEPGYSEELEPLATIEGFISIKLTPGANPQFQETRFIITGGTINERIPAPNSSYNYNDGDYGPWIVYLKSDCYGCGGWRLDRAGNHYPRYRCCNGNSCADMDPASWKSQNYVGRTTEGGICHFGREWGNNYMDVINHCIAISNPKNPCVCDYFPPCSRTVLECCDIDAKFHYSNWYDVLGPTGGAYGNPNCAVSAEICPENAEKRGIKWIGSHEPTSGYRGYVTQVIKAKHLNDIYTAITPALTGQHRMGGDWLYCKKDPPTDKMWKKYESVNLDTFRYRFDKCEQCEKPVTSDDICACHMNDLSYVLNKMLGNTCECLGEDDQYIGKQWWKIIAGKAPPTYKQCFCGGPCAGGYCESLEEITGASSISIGGTVNSVVIPSRTVSIVAPYGDVPYEEYQEWAYYNGTASGGGCEGGNGVTYNWYYGHGESASVSFSLTMKDKKCKVALSASYSFFGPADYWANGGGSRTISVADLMGTHSISGTVEGCSQIHVGDDSEGNPIFETRCSTSGMSAEISIS
jgi:hypothetical protein